MTILFGCSRSEYLRVVLNTVAGEGRRAVLKKKNITQRTYLTLKLINTVLSSAILGSKCSLPSQVVYIKGENQLRLYSGISEKLKKQGYKFKLFIQPDFLWLKGIFRGVAWPKLAIVPSIYLITLVTAYLLTSRKRFINLFYIRYYESISDVLSILGDSDDKVFLSLNDQAFECSAIILALRNKNWKRTIVFQHGVIIGHDYYFPVNSSEFWAWGYGSLEKFSSRWSGCAPIVTGRFSKDFDFRSSEIIKFNEKKKLKLLIAPSYRYSEMFALIEESKKSIKKINISWDLSIKFHPGTKFKLVMKIICRLFSLGVENSSVEMFDMAKEYDGLITKDSSSAVDFLLMGKTVFFATSKYPPDFLKNDVAISIKKLPEIVRGDVPYPTDNHRLARRVFLKNYLDV